MEDNKRFSAGDAEAEPSVPLFSIFKPKPRQAPAPRPAPAPREMPAPQKAAPPDPGLADRVEKLAGDIAALSARLDAALKFSLTREEAGKLHKPIWEELAGAQQARAEESHKAHKRIDGLEQGLAETSARSEAVPELLNRTGTLAGELSTLAARLDDLVKNGLTREEAGRLLETAGEEFERKLAKSLNPDACLALHVEELSVQLKTLSARLDAASWGRAEESRSSQKRLEALEAGVAEMSARAAELAARLPIQDAGLNDRVAGLSGKVDALAVQSDAAAWSRGEELQKWKKRIEELEREVARLSVRADAGLPRRVEKLAAELTALSAGRDPRLAERVEELAVQLSAFSARLDAAAWGRTEELQKSQKRIEELEREVARLAAERKKKD